MDVRKVLGQEYLPRVIDLPLQNALLGSGAIILEGARASGKTMTALNAANSFVFLDDPEIQMLTAVAPKSILEGETPRLLDEWQLAPELWNLVRRTVDRNVEPGQFILTGSAVPNDDATRHTGAGRFLRLRQRTMTWWEKAREARPQKSVSLRALFDGKLPTVQLAESAGLDEAISRILQPGFPAMTALTPAQSAARLRAYIDDVARTDIQRIASVRHEPEVIKHLIAALARSVASEVTYKTLATDVRAIAPEISAETVANYVELLQRLFIVEAQQPWTPTLRSRARVRTSPRWHLVDPAFAAAALGAPQSRLERDLNTLGTLFESAVIHDLMVFASALEGEVRHYRDSNKKEIDAIITLPDGRWGAVEVKLGGGQLKAGIESLENTISDIDTDSVGEPTFRLVVTGNGPTLVTDSGVVTAPLSALAP